MRRLLSAAAICLAALILSAGAAASLPSDSTAAKACAGRVSVNTRLGSGQLAFLERYLPCVVGRLRGSKAVVRARLNAIAQADVKAFAAAPVKSANSDIARAGASAGDKYCNKAVGAGILTDDTNPPPALTPLTVAEAVSSLFQLDQGVDRDAGTVYGFGYIRSVLFHDGPDRNALGFVVLSANCSVKVSKIGYDLRAPRLRRTAELGTGSPSSAAMP